MSDNNDLQEDILRLYKVKALTREKALNLLLLVWQTRDNLHAFKNLVKAQTLLDTIREEKETQQ